MLGTTQDGDVAARLSVKLDTGVITNCVASKPTAMTIGSEPVFGGVTDVRTKNTSGKPGIFLIRPKSFEAEGVGGAEADTEDLDVPIFMAGAAKVTNSHIEESDGPKLDEAAIVVSGGRGLGEADAFSLVDELASTAGAAGASRAIVDAGWFYSMQVGQTGKVVKPTVYIAAALGTAAPCRHEGSKNIIAINKDPEALILPSPTSASWAMFR